MKLMPWITGVAFAAMLGNTAAAGQMGDSDCPKEATRIIVMGDSLADGLWGALHRAYARCPAVQTLRLTEVSDDLAKTDADEWLDRYFQAATELDTRDSDVVIVQVGANDITTIRDGRSRESFGSVAWETIYADRVASLTRGLKQRVAQVFWFGLPVAGKSKLEEPYQSISVLQQAAVDISGGVFIDIHDLTTFGSGAFAQNATYQGQLRQLRHTDKVHFTKSGYDFVAQAVLDDLDRFTSERDRRAALRDVQLQ